MSKMHLSVATEHGTFTRNTYNDYTVIAVIKLPHNDGPWASWHRDLDKALKGLSVYGWGECLGLYSVETGKRVAPGRSFEKGARVAKAAPKPVKVYEFEKCGECDYRHPADRLRCGNCWRCHNPEVKCKTTKREIADSIERHNQYPRMYRVLTNVWRPFSEVMVTQCSCH